MGKSELNDKIYKHLLENNILFECMVKKYNTIKY